MLDVNEQPLQLALSPEERERVKAGLGREPTTVEWFAFDAQWSEHCSYKSSRPFLRRLPTKSADVVVGVGEDAGVVRLGEHAGKSYAFVVSHESHYHPSQFVSFEGAATGIGGIVLDVLCMGAHLIGVADPLRFGTSSDSRYIAQGVVDGVASYGNA
ncbi:MAG: AIR synthase related protein, partial [Vulcanimicrobiaceae bacterium]